MRGRDSERGRAQKPGLRKNHPRDKKMRTNQTNGGELLRLRRLRLSKKLLCTAFFSLHVAAAASTPCLGTFLKLAFVPPPSVVRSVGRQSGHWQSCCDGEKITPAAAVLVPGPPLRRLVVLIAHFKVGCGGERVSHASARTRTGCTTSLLPHSLPLLRSAWTERERESGPGEGRSDDPPLS